MIDKRLFGIAGESRKYIFLCVLFQCIGLAASVYVTIALAGLLQGLRNYFALSEALGSLPGVAGVSWIFFVRPFLLSALVAVVIGIPVRFLCGMIAGKMSEKAASGVKARLRDMIYQKLLRLGLSYQKHISTAEAIQLSGAGVEQLETYFGRYLPQLFYSMIAPVALFGLLTLISLKVAVVLLVCVPLIPLSIIFVQKFAKKLFQKYWGEYVALGDGFLENVQGLTTLKIYQADGRQGDTMNAQAERFRRITMKVLTMQLNSITLMDLVAYGGAALGTALALIELSAGRISLSDCIIIVLLSAEFFIPLRMLGSYFHIAMNGMAASGKMFKLFDIPEEPEKTAVVDDVEIVLQDLSFSYDNSREILKDVSMSFPSRGLSAIVGKSGSGKSTVAALLAGINKGYLGSLCVGAHEIREISEASLVQNIAMIRHQSHFFAGSIKENLQMAAPCATEVQMKEALDQVRLWGFLQGEAGLETVLTENAANLSGGQRQRLALARALLHDSRVLVFDEATSNIDVESETDIMALIQCLAKTKSVIVISHRLANVANADRIYVMEGGSVAESGAHDVLLNANGIYASLWREQRALEEIREMPAAEEGIR